MLCQSPKGQFLKELLIRKHSSVMGIVNVTPDSFSGDGFMDSQNKKEEILEKAGLWIEQGVDFLDVGGESTRPGATAISEEEELARVIPIIKALAARYTVPISIDTTKAVVAEAALNAGACIVNDVSGLMMDPGLCDVVRIYQVPVVLTHHSQAIAVHQRKEEHEPWTGSLKDFVSKVAHDLEMLAAQAMARGLTSQQLILDPGIGFGKTTTQNLAILKYIDRIKALNYPVLIGASRKSFIGHLTGAPVGERLPGSLLAVMLSALKGVDILRVHDVAETIQAVKMIKALQEIEGE